VRKKESVVTINNRGDKSWYQNGERHRLDGPAIELANGSKYWYQKGQLHRIDGPAIQYSNGDKSWYIRGRRFETKEAFFDTLTNKEKKIALFSEAFLNA
jgi:hypothetical protein